MAQKEILKLLVKKKKWIKTISQKKQNAPIMLMLRL